MRRFALIIATVLAVTLGTTAPAAAQTVKRFDTYNKDAPAFNLKHGTFRYYENATARVKMEHLSKRKTVVVLKYNRPGYSVTVSTKYRAGSRVTRAYRSDDFTWERIRGGFHARWDFARDVVTFKLGSRWLSGGRSSRAGFLAFSMRKGHSHGNHFGDYVSARVGRG